MSRLNRITRNYLLQSRHQPHLLKLRCFSLNSCLEGQNSSIRQDAVDNQSKIAPGSQSTVNSGDNILEAYRHSLVDNSHPQDVRETGVGIDYLLGTKNDIKKNESKVNQFRETCVGPMPSKSVRIGKSIEVDPSRGRDLGRTFQVLSALVIRDRVKADFLKQKFHERPGSKRKRTTCERWRKKFKCGFIGTVTRVQNLKSMGW